MWLDNYKEYIESILKGSTTKQQIEALVQLAKLNEIVGWKKEIKKRLDYYDGVQQQHTIDILKEQFSEYKEMKLQININNIVKKIIDRLSVVYKGEVQRTLEIEGEEASDQEKELWDELQKMMHYGTVLKRVNSLVNLCETILIRPVFDVIDNELLLAIHKPDNFDVIQHPLIPTKAIAIIYSSAQYDTFLSNYDPNIPRKTRDAIFHKLIYHYWDSNYYFRYEGDKERISVETNKEGTNPYGVLPFQRFTNKIPEDNYILRSGFELTNAQENINVKLTQLNYLIKTQSCAIPVFKGQIDSSEIKYGPLTPIIIPTARKDESEPDFYFVTPDSDAQAIRDEIDKEINDIAEHFEISPANFKLSAQPQSGYAIQLENLPLLELRLNQVELYERNEQKLFEVIKRVWNYHSQYLPPSHKLYNRKFSDNTQLHVTIMSPEFPSNPIEQQETWDWELKNKLTTPVNILMEKDRLTEEEAEIEYNKMLKWWEKHPDAKSGFDKFNVNPPPEFEKGSEEEEAKEEEGKKANPFEKGKDKEKIANEQK